MKVGDRVVHAGHGKGQIVSMNKMARNRYLEEHPADAVRMAGSVGLLGSLAAGFYDSTRYPYVVQFEDGYKDVYSESDLKEV